MTIMTNMENNFVKSLESITTKKYPVMSLITDCILAGYRLLMLLTYYIEYFMVYTVVR